jgi:hypothetical protein
VKSLFTALAFSRKKRRSRGQGAGSREQGEQALVWSRGAERNMGMFAERFVEKPRHKGRSYWGGVQALSQ